MLTTITINAKPLDIEIEEGNVGEEFETVVPHTNPEIKVKCTKYRDKITIDSREWEVFRKEAHTPAGRRQFYEHEGWMFQTLEQLVNHLINN
ncbi:hypothetical protein [Leadbetterella byssophila]|uniref:hypothetical protein n=1 Tax=Leadbetterella byssophila TaxID=316068 RepID=UPI0039A34786